MNGLFSTMSTGFLKNGALNVNNDEGNKRVVKKVSVEVPRESETLSALKRRIGDAQRTILIYLLIWLPIIKVVVEGIAVLVVIYSKAFAEGIKLTKFDRGEAVYLYLVCNIPLTTLVSGKGFFAILSYPEITVTNLNSYIYMRFIVWVLDGGTGAMYLTCFGDTKLELVAVVLYAVIELACIVIVRVYAEQRHRIHRLAVRAMEKGMDEEKLRSGEHANV